MSGIETVSETDEFADQLAEVFTVWADSHATPDDETAMRFVGTDASGITAVSSCSPRQFVQEIIDRTPQGLHTIEWYRQISENLGNPTGQRVIDDLRNMYSTEQ